MTCALLTPIRRTDHAVGALTDGNITTPRGAQPDRRQRIRDHLS
jgi:hypothetical protein